VKIIKTILKGVVGLMALFFIVGLFLGEPSEQRSASNPASTARQVASITSEQQAAQEDARKRREELLLRPDLQTQFISVVNSATATFSAAGRDEFAQGATRPARRQAICATALGRELVVQDWVGQVSTRSTNNEGKGVLRISIGPDVAVKTWNNALSDIGDRTLIEPGSPAFNVMGTLRNGDWVRFSGRFFPDQTDCVREPSMTIRGTMTSPEFIFRFDDIRRIELP
jgi:hypothetical protein